MKKQFIKLAAVVLAVLALMLWVPQVSPAFASETETETDYYICGDFTDGSPAGFTEDPDTGLYTYTANLRNSTMGWNEYEFFLTLNGVDYGAQDWVIYDCAEELVLSQLNSSAVYKLLLCNTRTGTYTFVFDPENTTLTVSGDHDDYGAFLVFTELVADGENPYYFMDELGETDTFGDVEKTMMVEVPSWDPDGYWDIQIASGGEFYGKNGLKIDGAANQIYTLEEDQICQFASMDPHVWYDFYFGAESHKLIVKDGGRIECEIDFHVCAEDGTEIPNAEITADPEAPFYEASIITVTAPEVEGYHFIGWYDSYTDQDSYGELLSTQKSFDYTVRDFNYEETQSLYAVYGEGTLVSVTGISLDQTSAVMATSKTTTEKPYTITEPSTLQLTAVIEPADASNRNVIWSSSDEKIASVDENGLVTAYHYSKDPVVITVTTEDGGFTATCEVQTRFNDVAGSPNKGDADYQYFFTPVYWAADHDPTVTNGYDTIFFGTGMNCKREDMITFLWRAAGKPPYKKASTFKDVTKGKYYYDAIMWAAENGITKGYSDGTFGVGKQITREDTVTFIYRAAGKPKFKKASSFTDVVKGKYYYDAIMWAAENGITKGYSTGPNAGKFGVGFNVLREDIVTFLHRAASKNLI